MQMVSVISGMSNLSIHTMRSITVRYGGNNKRLLKTLRQLDRAEPILTNLTKCRNQGIGDNIVVRVNGVVIELAFGRTQEVCHSDIHTKQYVFNNTKALHKKRLMEIQKHNPMIAVGMKTVTHPQNDRLAIATRQYSTHNFKRQLYRIQSSDQQLRFFQTQRGSARDLNSLKSKIFSTDIDKEKVLKELADRDSKTIALLRDANLSKEEKNSIKLAFAEGFLNGTTAPQPSKKTARVLSIVQQVVSIVAMCLIILIVVSLSATSSVLYGTGQVAISPEAISVTFKDVKGADDAKEELEEVVEFLRNPQKFSKVGGKLPKGLLLVGPPGTGKTLLARALAGEAGVPFFHTCGAEFEEMLVGQGARRVRDLFKMAKERAPCVIFIDEIDAVGCRRTNSILHPHANQTVNQLLAEMDGFNPNQGVIVLGATNRRDDLDPALLRPGRFDLEVLVAAPDYKGRKDILSLYLNKVRVSNDVDIDVLARGTVGFTGADLENMVNQAAIRAAAENKDFVSMMNLEAARDKAIMGPEIKNRQRDDESNLITSYHEAGHALVAYFTKDAQPLHKVTIVARGSSLGHTSYIPEKDKYYITKSELLARLDTMMGGRAAEDLVFGPEKITSGAASDLKSATNLATQMVRDWGMSEKAGLRTYPHKPEVGRQEDIGHAAQDLVDVEIRKFIDASYERAKTLLKTHAAEHKLLAEKLLELETLDSEQIKKLLSAE